MIARFRKQLGKGTFQRRTGYALAGLATAFGLAIGGSGCGGGRPNSSDTALNTVSGERLGAVMAQGGITAGDVVLVHLSEIPGQAAQWIDGLETGLGGQASITELGPAELPDEAKATMGGFGALSYAMRQYPDAAAIVTALPVGEYERPTFPANHPPIYALGWSYVPDSIHLFKGKHMVAGVFEQPVLPPAVDTSTLTPEELFDRNYVVVTPENIRQVVGQY
jgi:hypothetical protein